MNQKKQHQCLAILRATIGLEPVDWQDIVKAVNAQMTVRNWLYVRGVLQYARDRGEFERLPSVHVEQYRRIEPVPPAPADEADSLLVSLRRTSH
ncbi:hypothetical protein [Burkholderia territorii]|uniref:hypothetical protein n=1 Tax=Burkholderia territorii TaxID=1503055 RepID=UPI000753C812|nr:hypothetical protein [Burkholderia territorii]KWO59793.1 hypothetical protein WT98_31055 [Burkholderia territorii]